MNQQAAAAAGLGGALSPARPPVGGGAIGYGVGEVERATKGIGSFRLKARTTPYLSTKTFAENLRPAAIAKRQSKALEALPDLIKDP